MPQAPLPEKDLHAQKSREDYRQARSLDESLLNAAGLGIITTNPGGIITSFNQSAVTLLGYSPDEVIGKTTPVIFHLRDEIEERAKQHSDDTGETLDPVFDIIVTKARRQKTPDRSEWTFIRKNRSRFHGSLTIICLRDERDNITGFAGIIADLSTQLTLMQQIEISEEKFRLLAENIPGAIYLCHNDENYTIIYLNDAIHSLTGYTKEDYYSEKITYAGIIHPEDRKIVTDTINQCLAERRGYQLSYRIRHASGEERWFHESGVGLFEDDKLMMLEGFIQDVTKQHEVEEQLRKLAEENLRFFNSPINLNTVVDFDGNVVRISPSWTKIVGWSEEELRSHHFLNFTHPEDLARAKEELKHLATVHEVHTFESRLACKDGSYRWLLWALAPDRDSKLIYASAIDISRRKESEETILHSKSNLETITLHLQEQNRKLDEFAHIISHNLRAPVSNIQALINLLDEKSDINDYKLIFDKLSNVSKNLGETMNELMDTLKAKTQPHIDLSEIRFKEVLDKVVQSLEGELIVAEAAVTFDFNSAPTVRYSKPYLESIFQNLLTNAVKYRSPDRKPSIHFKTCLNDNHLELEVTDNGQGIDMEKFGDKLFGLHKTFHEHQEARGVGLFLVKTQVEALGGSIRVRSEVNRGTTFRIRFN